MTKQKSVYKTLRENEELFRQITESIAEVFWICDVKMENMLYISQGYERVWGRTCKSLYQNPRSFLDAIHPDDLERVLADLQIKKTGKTFSLEYRIIKPDGAIRWIWDRGFPIRDKTARIYRYAGIAQDVTERKLAEEALRESEERFRKVFEHGPFGISISGKGRKFLNVNDTLCRMLGYSDKELLKFTSKDITHPEDRNITLDDLEKLAKKEISFFKRIKRYVKKDQSVMWGLLTATSVFNDRGEHLYNIGMVTDITEHKLAEKALIDSERKYRSLFESSKDAILTCSCAGKLLDINPSGLELFGYSSKDDFLNLNIARDICSDPKDREKLLKEIKKHGYVKDFETILKKKDGNKFFANIMANAVYDENDRIEAYHGLIRDITEHKTITQQLARAQKMEALGEFTSSITHEFKNILTVISGYGNLLKLKTLHDMELMDSVEMILESSKRGGDLLQSVLALGKKGPDRLIPIDPNNIMRGAEKLLQRLLGEEIQFRISYSNKDLTVMADSGQIAQLLINLATNARDAMPDGGVFTISAEAVQLNGSFTKKYRHYKAGKYVLITVRDNGIGMDEKTFDRAFDPFFTTKDERGSGLGLFIAYGIIKRHNGYVDVESELGKGTVFKIYLPLIKSKKAVESGEISRLPGGTETILLAEDDQSVRKFMREILEKFGYQVIKAKDGEDAIKKYRENKEKIQILIFDIVMPRKNGMQAYDEIKKIPPGPKILYMSGYSRDIISKKGFLEEGAHFISKPIVQADLLNKVREILDN